MADWNRHLLGLASAHAQASKDPSTKIGAVIARPDRTIVSMGYNGFARGVQDWPGRYEDREFKLAAIVHAEANAILTAREPLHGCTISVAGLPPCAQCAAFIIQAGIKEVVSSLDWSDVPERWKPNMAVSRIQFEEAGIRFRCEAVEITAE